MYSSNREILKGARILDQPLTCSLVYIMNETYHLGRHLGRKSCVWHKFGIEHFHENVDTISFDLVAFPSLICCKGSGRLSIPKCLWSKHILGMWSSFPHPYAVLQEQIPQHFLCPNTIWKYKCPRKWQECLYNTIIGVPDPCSHRVYMFLS